MINVLLLIPHIPLDTLSLDSLNYKLGEIDKTISQQMKAIQMNSDLWVPLVSTILGGLLVIFAQHFERKSGRNSDKRINLRETYANCRKLEELSKFNYRILATARTDVEFEEIERRIGENKADFIGNVRKIQAIKKLNDNIVKKLENISDFSNEKMKSYDAIYDKKEGSELCNG